MTYKQMKDLQRGNPPFFQCAIITADFEHHYVQPIPDDMMAHSKSEKPSTDFNSLSIEQAAGMTKFKYMDSLHKADAVAQEFNKATRLITEFNETGESTFVSRRISKK